MGLWKKIRRAAGQAIKRVASEAIQATPVGRVAVRLRNALKSQGVNTKTAVPTIQPLSVRSNIVKYGPAKPTREKLSAGVLTMPKTRGRRKRVTDLLEHPSVIAPEPTKKRKSRQARDATSRKAPSPAQLAAREKFSAMVKARAAARKAG